MTLMTKQRLDLALTIKSVSDSGEFEGYGSVFNTVDSYSDVVTKGAFSKTLAKWQEKGRFPALLWQHDTNEPIGVYTEMREDDVGLFVKGRLLVDEDPLAKRAHAHMKAGSLSGMSIGYIEVESEYDRAKGVYLLKEIDLWEVSLVTFPANDEARISSVKNTLGRGEIPRPSEVEKALRDSGFSRSQALAFMAKGYSAIAPRDSEVMNAFDSIKTLFLNT